MKSIAVFKNILRTIDIDIIGTEAKIDAIEKAKGAKNHTPEFQEALEQMQVMQDIEVAGARARKRAAEAGLEKAQKFCELMARRDKIPAELKKLKRRLENNPRAIAELEVRLTRPQPFGDPVVSRDNKALIRPVPASSRVGIEALSR